MIVLRHFYKLCSQAKLLYFLDVFFRFLVIGVFILIILMIVGAGVLAQIVLAAVLLIWLIVAYSRSSYFGYEFMNGGLIIQCGTFSCRQDTVPYHKIESVYLTRNHLEKIGGLAKLHIQLLKSYVVGSDAESFYCINHIKGEFIIPLPKKTAHEAAVLILKKVEEEKEKHPKPESEPL